MSRVFAIATPSLNAHTKTLDLSGLAQFGEVIHCLPSNASPEKFPTRAMETLTAALMDFDPETDHIVWIGGPTLAVLMVRLVLRDRNIGEVSWLRFQRRLDPTTGRRAETGGYYESVRIPLVAVEENWNE